MRTTESSRARVSGRAVPRGKALFAAAAAAASLLTGVAAVPAASAAAVPAVPAVTSVTPAGAEDLDGLIAQQLQEVEAADLGSYLSGIDQGIRDALPGLSLRDLTSPGRGLDPVKFMAALGRLVGREARASARLLGELVLVAAVCSVLSVLQQGLGAEVLGVAQTVCLLAVAGAGIGTFTVAVNLARSTIQSMQSFMLASLPVMIALLVSVGGVASGAVISPIMFACVNLVGTVTGNFVFPALMLSVALDLAGRLSGRVQVGRVAGLLREASVIAMGVVFCLFLGLVTVRGIGASIADGVALRTAKFLTSTFVPVVGKMFSDSMAAVAGCSLLLKAAVGTFGLAAVLGMCAYPVVQVVCMVFTYKIAGAVTQPLGDARVSDCMDALGNSLLLVLACLAMTALVFFVAISIIVGAGNLTVMLR